MFRIFDAWVYACMCPVCAVTHEVVARYLAGYRIDGKILIPCPMHESYQEMKEAYIRMIAVRQASLPF